MAALDEKQIGVIVCCAVLTVLAITAVGLRFYSISIVHRKPKLHDALCIVSLVMLLGYTISILVGIVDGGVGLHVDQSSPQTLTIGLKAFFSSQFFWAISIACFRLGILEFYVQTFTTKVFRAFAYGAMSIVFLFFIGSIATILRLCVPMALNWDKSLRGTCGDNGGAELAGAGFNLALDVIIVLLPLPVVWELHMSTQKKAAVMATFALSLGISAINLARIMHVLRCDLLDYTFCTANKSILTVAEMAVGITAACVPMLGPVFFPERRRRFTKTYCPTSNHIMWRGSRSERNLRSPDGDRSTDMVMTPKGETGRESPNRDIRVKSKSPSPSPSPPNVGDGEVAVWRQFVIQGEENALELGMPLSVDRV